MTRKLNLGMVALLALVATSSARAEEPCDVCQVSTFNGSTQFASMQAELDSLRATVQQISYAGGGDVACGDCGGCGCDCYCDVGCGGVYGGVELVFVKPRFEQGIEHDVDDTGTQAVPNNASFDYYATPRLYLGWRNCEGLGVRARYWTFDQSESLQNPNFAPETWIHALDVTAWDFEATQLVCWGPLQMNFAGGVRYGHFEHGAASIDSDDGDFHALTSDFEGWGPTLAMEARRPIGCRGLALVGNVRSSLLFGETKTQEVDTDSGDVFDTEDYHETMSLGLESQIGIEYSRCTSRGGVLTLRALLEGQYWGDVSAVEIDEQGGDRLDEERKDAVGFFGATIGVEYAR